MAKIEIFDPALCCPTGVCGPHVDPELTRIANAVFLLEKKGVDIKRYNLGNEPQFFVDEKEVQKLLEEQGIDALPVVLVDKQVQKIGGYPSNQELATWTGIQKTEIVKKETKTKDLPLL
ncbi:arsenite efflux transporter metallochaperone ArsD [Aquibacillus rhizosphaerae]|uniref:Arsenite efflux transporter metallochaperone ArsD n=1 Tax=Aquibacillus rhizosphaerae TaxID=3051431 RepID=A0ABT7L9H3_9BACI|nr:arsenite efflux transporter metallochaperone ArsD [Aquibacillus sp. LR5S19]MDL4841221.1 arsenite efflux transporter metallochaperone ArsD [Aquibacillus sp. LR5S19]